MKLNELNIFYVRLRDFNNKTGLETAHHEKCVGPTLIPQKFPQIAKIYQ